MLLPYALDAFGYSKKVAKKITQGVGLQGITGEFIDIVSDIAGKLRDCTLSPNDIKELLKKLKNLKIKVDMMNLGLEDGNIEDFVNKIKDLGLLSAFESNLEEKKKKLFNKVDEVLEDESIDDQTRGEISVLREGIEKLIGGTDEDSDSS